MFDRILNRGKRVKPQTRYETECWSPDAERRGQQLRDIINPENIALLVYYPAYSINFCGLDRVRHLLQQIREGTVIDGREVEKIFL